jgi:hypothetical protein
MGTPLNHLSLENGYSSLRLPWPASGGAGIRSGDMATPYVAGRTLGSGDFGGPGVCGG